MYEAFSVISGVTLVLLACLPGLSLLERIGAVAAGAVCIGYSVYVSHQTSGIWYFSSLIFVIPFWVAGYVLYLFVSRRSDADGTTPASASAPAVPTSAPPTQATVAPPIPDIEPDPADEGRSIARTVFSGGRVRPDELPPLTEGQRIARAAFADAVPSPSDLPARAEAPARDADDGLTEGQRIARAAFGVPRG